MIRPCPRWVYDDGSAVDYTVPLPQRPWSFGSLGHGAVGVTASGIPAGYELRRDYTLVLGLRFPETEWPDVERLVRHLQRARPATLYLDSAVDDVAHTVYGESPAMGEPIRPRRGSEPSMLELEITVRSVTETLFTEAYFEDPDGLWFFREVDGVLVMTNVPRDATHYLDIDAGGLFVNDAQAEADALLRYHWGRARMFDG